ncbi:MAG: DUF2911 domain-containing protein [Saprospirales bacterium]|nr:DUF2911 domain-containing protein [Saprospirales bacterium]MBK8489738.1 DUF2911 domain-containing protein [Saprospirales bacterium]
MKITQFLFYSTLLVFAIACGPASTGQEGEAMGATDSTGVAAPEAENAPYTIQVLNADLPSPRKEMTGSIGSVDITVNYGSPSVRGREIWGGLEPYSEVWRSGANEATTVQFSKNVQIEGKDLPAGRYGLFTIPEKGAWTIIFNSVADQWGDFEYDATKDVLRVESTPKTIKENAEQLDFLIEGNTIVLRWEKIALPFSVAATE